MSTTTNSTVTTITLPIAQNPTVDFAKLIKKYLFHWPLFLVTLAVFLIGSYFYVKYAKPIYPVTSTLEFKNDVSTTNGVSSDNKTGISELDQISTPVIVENEVEVMQSKKIMYQVVTQLKLWVNYAVKDGLLSTDLYKSTPVDFEFIKQAGAIDPQGMKLQITIKDRNHFALVDQDTKTQHVYKFGQSIKSEFGSWKLLATPNIDNNFYGKLINVTVMDPDAVTDNYLSALKVGLENKDAPFVNLSISDVVPQRGKDILNSVMEIYNKNAMADKNRKSQATIDFIDKRLDSISKDLISNEKLIAMYQTSEGIADISQQTQTDLAGQQQNAKELTDLNLQIQTVEEIENYINSPQGNAMPATGNLTDNGLNSMLDKLSDLQLKKDQMLETTPEKNPIFDPINRQIATLRSSIKEKVVTLKSQLLAQRKQLEGVSSHYSAAISRVPTISSKNSSMTRDADIKEKLYSFLLEQREKISLRYSSAIPDAEIVDDAHAGKVKWPKPAIVYVLASILGICLPIGLIYTRDSFDVKITNRKQIEDVVTIPILGELQYQESSTPIVISKERGKFAIGEQFRVLRTNLYHVHNNNDSGRVTLFTSSTGGEGKSFVSANLAVTLAYAGRKTIIMEMDLRKPKISLTFGLPMDVAGISDYLDGEVRDIKSLIQPSGIPGLDVMGCGSILPNPSELLENEKLDELIGELKKMYDDVLIDSPPIHLVTDALIIARVADASVYIMRQGYTQKVELDFINEIKSEERFPKLNIVFNGIKREKYGYGYNYDNSYYNTYTNKPKKTFKGGVRKFFSRF
ncbi:MAG: polysaccharide biosynthesis tyrosine autokinase [Bacteroidetes bacterium]|nr:polysaccharide biosynthesis tyrosine autokinase [Bacteroidota bacterium]